MPSITAIISNYIALSFYMYISASWDVNHGSACVLHGRGRLHANGLQAACTQAVRSLTSH